MMIRVALVVVACGLGSTVRLRVFRGLAVKEWFFAGPPGASGFADSREKTLMRQRVGSPLGSGLQWTLVDSGRAPQSMARSDCEKGDIGSALELGREHRLLERVEMELEADDRGRGVGGDRQRVLLHGEQGELVAVRAVALGRAGAAIARLAEIGAGLQRAFRQQARGGIAGVELEFADGGRDVDHHPVPEARAGRRVGVEAVDGEAPGAGRRSRPRELRALVAAAAAEAVVGRQDVIQGEHAAFLEVRAGEGERHRFLLLWEPLTWRRSWRVYRVFLGSGSTS